MVVVRQRQGVGVFQVATPRPHVSELTYTAHLHTQRTGKDAKHDEERDEQHDGRHGCCCLMCLVLGVWRHADQLGARGCNSGWRRVQQGRQGE
jgi:hypothetical protein